MGLAVATRSWLLHLYPQSWRERYADEFTALLEDCALTPYTVFDVLLGALDAHIDPQDATGRILRMLQQTRRSAITVFCAWIAFVVAGLAFNQMIEDDVRRLNGAHPDIAAAYYVVMATAVIALLAVLVGGAPIALAVVRRAWSERRRDILLLFTVPVISLTVWLLWTWLLATRFLGAANTAATQNAGNGALFLSWVGIFILAAIASTAAVSIAISRAEIAPRLFRFALAPAVVTTLAMVVMLGAVVAWGLAVHNDVPAYLSSDTSPFHNPVSAHLIGQIAVMALATFVAIAALIRGLRAPGGGAGMGTPAVGAA